MMTNYKFQQSCADPNYDTRNFASVAQKKNIIINLGISIRTQCLQDVVAKASNYAEASK